MAIHAPSFRRSWLVFWALTVAAPSHAETLTAHVATVQGKALADAVVTALPVGSAAISAKPGTRSTLIQEGKQFLPFVLPVQIGTTVVFPNRDPFRHQVYSFSPAKTFELKLYGSSEVGEVTFDMEGPVALGCNIHDNMLAYIYVVGTPYFATTTAEGNGTVSQLPAGSYIVKVWHPNQKAGQVDAGTINVTDTAEITVQVEMRPGRLQRKPGAIDETGY